MKRKSVLLFCLSFFLLQAYPQIPIVHGDLTENADAIIDNLNEEFIQTDINNATYKVTKTVTVLNKQGEKYGNFYTYTDKFRELKDFSGVVKNAAGAEIRKIGKKNLITSSLSTEMATDGYHVIYNCQVPTYPYTVEYTYTERWKNGILSYPPFMPAEGFKQSVRKANYRIELPADLNLRYKSNFDCQIKEELINGKHVYSFSIEELKATEKEPLSPISREIIPMVFIAPSKFCYDSYCGDLSGWNTYGAWIASLLKERDKLPADFSDKIKAMVKDATTDREKVEILYKFLQDNWRYVSIQLGIGGFRPIEAASVCKTNYGDCKGLSNLMKAMLNEVGVKSYYTVIYSGDKKYFPRDFSNGGEGNHVILHVPLANDSIWLECTSQTLPFGFVHDDIAGHDALIINENEGVVCRLPEYADELNERKAILNIQVAEDGTAKGHAEFVEHLHWYTYFVKYMTSKDRKEVLQYLNNNVRFPKVQFGQVATDEDKSPMPSCILKTDFDIGEFANRTGSRMFIPVCPLDKREFDLFKSDKREHDIVIDNGFTQTDTIIYNLPEGYTLESMPKDISVKNRFGALETSVKQDGTKVVYSQKIAIFSGRYSKEDYPSYKGFYKQVSDAAKRRIVLKKS